MNNKTIHISRPSKSRVLPFNGPHVEPLELVRIPGIRSITAADIADSIITFYPRTITRSAIRSNK